MTHLVVVQLLPLVSLVLLLPLASLVQMLPLVYLMQLLLLASLVQLLFSCNGVCGTARLAHSGQLNLVPTASFYSWSVATAVDASTPGA